jgi:hypothetical protein
MGDDLEESMRNRLSYGLVLAAAAMWGCGSNPVANCPGTSHPPFPDGGCGISINPEAGGGDAGTNTEAGMHDAGGDMGPQHCGTAGLAGGACRAGACQASLHCFDPAAFGANSSTIQGAFGLQQGDLTDPQHAGYQTVQNPTMCATHTDMPTCAADSANGCAWDATMNHCINGDSAPFNAFEGTFCAQECDTTATTDTCGACAHCSRDLTQMPLIQAFGGVASIYGNTGMFPYANEGVCRLQCTYDHTMRSADGVCDSQHTCDAFGGVCVEACTTDNECNTAFGVTYSGQTVTLVDHTAGAAHCNTTTGRCEVAGTAGKNVGDTCMSGNDCAPGVGVCLNGGHCSEFNGCTNGMVCGATNNGVCLAVNGTMHTQNLCIMGCNHATDCGAGNVCNMLTAAIGSFTGYCLGGCMTDDECIATETCTDYTTTDATTGAATAHAGNCVHRCGGTGAPITVGQVGMSAGTTAATGDCLTTEYCQADHTGATYGYCQPMNHLCGTPNTNSLPAPATDCAIGQLCDETLATPHDAPTTTAPRGALEVENFGDGHCVAPCVSTAASCTGTAVCVAADANCTGHADMTSCGADTAHHCAWNAQATANTACPTHTDMATCAADTAHVCTWNATSATTGTCGGPPFLGACTSPLAGLCRQACTTDAQGTCPTDQHCDVTLGYCVECPTYVPTGMTAPANCM